MEQLKRKTNPIRMRNYGRIIQDMITVACDEQDARNREAMILYIGQCMRQKNLIWNRDQDSGTQRIKDDIATLSNGRLDTSFAAFDEVMQRKIEEPVRKQKYKKNWEWKIIKKAFGESEGLFLIISGGLLVY